MLSVKELQVAYNHLYIVLREFIWPVDVVEKLAEFEIEVYNAMPNIETVRVKYNELKALLNHKLDYEDKFWQEELQKALNDLDDKIYDTRPEDIYFKLMKVDEVLV